MRKKLLALGIVSIFALGACTADGGGTSDTAGPAETEAPITTVAG